MDRAERTDYLLLDVGLLDDAGFGRLSAAARGAWVTAYLLQKRRTGHPFADHAELCRLLRKEGIDDPDMLVEQMRAMLEGPDPDGSALSILHYDEYQRPRFSRVRTPEEAARHAAEEKARRARRRAERGQQPTDPRGLTVHPTNHPPTALVREGVDEGAVRPQSVHSDGGRSPGLEAIREIVDRAKKGGEG